MHKSISVKGFELQQHPRIFVAAIPGLWLLKHATTSWRIDDPEKGFQRVVKEDRARQIAASVIDQGRTFPNAIVLATNVQGIQSAQGELVLPENLKFLVVDGQHRLWAQRFANRETVYSCLLHLGLTEVQMAKLFLEINDNQKRVPSSLRWDLVRLVRPDDDHNQIAAADIVYELTTSKESPLYQRVDLTGEQGEIKLKQASVAPEIKSLVTSKREFLKGLDLEDLYEVLIRYLAALRAYDTDAWRTGDTPFMKARVFRAALKLLPDVLDVLGIVATEVSVDDFSRVVKKIKRNSLDTEAIIALQGSAGIKQIHEMLKSQISRKR